MQEAGYKTCMAGKWQLQVMILQTTLEQKKDVVPECTPKMPGLMNTAFSIHFIPKTKVLDMPNRNILKNGKIVEKSIDEYGPDMWVNYINGFVDRNKGKEEPFFI